jgi:hypothetical protein
VIDHLHHNPDLVELLVPESEGLFLANVTRTCTLTTRLTLPISIYINLHGII